MIPPFLNLFPRIVFFFHIDKLILQNLDMSIEIANQLFAIVGMYLKKTEEQKNTYDVYISNLSKRHKWYSDSLWPARINAESLENIFKSSEFLGGIFKKTSNLYVIDNPYKECTCVEEMLIKKDLYANR